MRENNPAVQTVGIDLRFVHSCFMSVEVQHERTTMRCATIAEESSLSHCYCRFSGPKRARNGLPHAVRRVTDALSGGSEIAGNRGFSQFATLYFCPRFFETEGQKAGRLPGGYMARPKTPVRLKNAMKKLFSLWHVLASSRLSWQEVATRHPRAVERRAFPQVDTHEISPEIRRFRGFLAFSAS